MIRVGRIQKFEVFWKCAQTFGHMFCSSNLSATLSINDSDKLFIYSPTSPLIPLFLSFSRFLSHPIKINSYFSSVLTHTWSPCLFFFPFQSLFRAVLASFSMCTQRIFSFVFLSFLSISISFLQRLHLKCIN